MSCVSCFVPQIDTRGLGVLLVDYLTTVEWTSFELLGEALKLHPTLLSKALRHLEAVSINSDRTAVRKYTGCR